MAFNELPKAVVDVYMPQTALITGASSGIGLELGKLIAPDHDQLVITARSEEKLQRLARELENRHDTTVHVVSEDLSQTGSSRRLVQYLASNNLETDVLINNAGYGLLGPFAEQPEEELMRMLQLNMNELTRLTRLLLPGMIKRKRGKILNVASTAAFQPGPFMAAYYASKAYVLSYSQALSEELRDHNIDVTALCPGPTETGFQDRAGMDASPLFKIMPVQDAATVAKAGYRGMQKGKRIVVPGLINKLLVYGSRFMPRRLLTKIVRRMQQSRR